ncbi:MAG: hypothetical protein E6R14_08775, partial [Thermomicrobiales bacterium]
MFEGIGGYRMQMRLRHIVAIVALLAGLLVTPLAGSMSAFAQDSTARTIALDVYRCPPGVTLQAMIPDDCSSITAGVDVILTSINGSIAPLTISNATLDGNTFRWDTTTSGSATDEWGFKHSTLPTGTSAFLVQGEGVAAGQSTSFDYRFTTSEANPSASLDMYLLMSADAPVIEPPVEEDTPAEPATTEERSEVTPQPTAGLRPSPTATTAPLPTEAAPADDASVDDTVDAAADEAVAPADTGDVFVPGDQVTVAEGPLNLRSAAGTSSSSLGSLAIGTQLTIVSGPVAANGYNWYQVTSSSGQTGWVIVDALQIVPDANANFAIGDQVFVFDGPINLRSAAGTGAPVIQSVPQEAVLTILSAPSASNGYTWYQVQTADGATGWVAADFLQK